MLKKLWSTEKGFTLMELIIVIVILGILALIAVPRLLGFADMAEKSADEEYAAVLGRAAELYFAANPDTTFVATDNQLGALETANLVSSSITLQYYTGAVVVHIAPSGAVDVDFGTDGDVWVSQ